MRLITLINDWQNDSMYYSQVIGFFSEIVPEATIKNITPDLPLNDIMRAALVLRFSLKFFPKNTIHCNFVDKTPISHRILIATYKNQYIISPDNGFIQFVTGRKYDKIYCFPRSYSPFDLLMNYAYALEKITKNELNNEFEVCNDPKDLILPQPVIKLNQIIAHIIYIDKYGNLFLNISKKKFLQITENKRIKITVGRSSFIIYKLVSNYDDVREGDLFALFSETGLLEIGQYGVNLRKVLDLKIGDEIIIELSEKNTIA